MTTRHPLAVLREFLLDHETPGKLLEIADKYLHSMGKLGSEFVLPKQHEVLLPILEYYAGDLPGWVAYVKSIRDNMDRGTDRWRAVYELYRTLEVRNVQRERRERLNAAVDMAVRLGWVQPDFESKRRYANRCTNEWARMRTSLLDSVRSRTAKGRISEEERAELLERFWSEIDEFIQAGELPRP